MLYFEIATEEAIRKFTVDEIQKLLYEIKNNIKAEIFERILFCVIQSGTALKDGINIGNYNNDRLVKMLDVVKQYNKLSKEHNGDYMKKEIMINRFNTGLDSLNIAPEIGVFETKIFLNKLIADKDQKNIDLFYQICYDSGKWKKWVSDDFNPIKNKIKLIEICGHYVFSNNEFQIIKKMISKTVIEKEIHKKILTLFSQT